ncbi:LPS export ABC transporter periplasmic protein LptC [Castellaniella sp.]|uniref:LPS export ABC transporter periplasmic protein LptC n=1 Tax=Castellaniella sp. TaxID=1955812 RepID=UPI00355FA97A
MKERMPGLVAILLLGLLVLGTWWASDYALQSIQIDPPRRLTHERDSWSGAFVMVRSDARGQAVNRLEGTAMEHFPDTDSYEIDHPRAVGHQPDSPVTVGTALHGELDQKGERIVLTGDAHLQRLATPESKLLDVRSEKLVIEPEHDLVHTDQPAVVIHGTSTLRGTGMRYDNRTRQLTVTAGSNVKISGEDQAARTSGQKDPQP